MVLQGTPGALYKKTQVVVYLAPPLACNCWKAGSAPNKACIHVSIRNY